MKRGICFLLLTSLVLFSSASTNTEEKRLIQGRVSCEGRAISGVSVSDGFLVCLTDDNGKYSLAVDPDSRFIYISSPAGYTVEIENSVPRFFHKLPSGNDLNHTVNFQLKKALIDDTNHGFVVWADPQVKNKEEVLQARQVAEELGQWLKRYDDLPFHGLGCGDIVGDNPALYDSIRSLLTPVGIPFYQSLGNHDMQYTGRSNKGAEKLFEENFGPAYYSFNKGEIHYVVLNNVFYLGRDYFYIGYLTEEQLSWLEQDLAVVEEGKTVVVALHIPTALNEEDVKQFSYSSIAQSLVNKSALYRILEPYQAHIISGHLHQNSNLKIAPGLFEHNISSVCGAWWQGPYAEDGTPKGYAVFEARGSELCWYFKSFGYENDYQFRAYAVGSNPEQSEYLTANVWNWDPEWKVYWYEDGQRMGEMERYSGVDPETANVYSEKQKLDYKWITARKSNHMFRAKPEIATSEFAIEVIDRFGNHYKLDLD